jgi:hypothetical protein
MMRDMMDGGVLAVFATRGLLSLGGMVGCGWTPTYFLRNL